MIWWWRRQNFFYEIAPCFCTDTRGYFVQIFGFNKFLCISYKKWILASSFLVKEFPRKISFEILIDLNLTNFVTVTETYSTYFIFRSELRFQFEYS